MLDGIARVLVAAGALAMPVSAAAAEWSAVATIAQGATPLTSPAVAMDTAGNALVAWLQGQNVVAVAERAAGQTAWQQRGTVSQADAADVGAALGADGSAIVAWVRAGVVEFAHRPAGGSFGASVAIPGSGTNAAHLQVVFDPQGNAFFAWNHVPMPMGANALSWSARTATGVIGPVQPFDNEVMADNVVRIAFAASGEGIAVLDAPNPVSGYLIGAAVRPPGAVFGPGINIGGTRTPRARRTSPSVPTGGPSSVT